METKTIIKWVIISLSLIALAFAVKLTYNHFFGSEPVPQAIQRGDVKSNYEESYKKDTEIKFVDRIVYKQLPPKVIYEQKVDTVFIEKQKDKDLILQIEKDGTALKATTVNINGQKIKEYHFKDVSNDFKLTSQDSSLYLKSLMWEWEGISLGGGYQYSSYDSTLKTFNANNLYLTALARLRLLNKYNFSVGTKYFPLRGGLPTLNFETSVTIK